VIRIDDVTELERKEQLLRQAQKMESIGTLASGIAHDFNNILGVILGTVSLIEFKTESGGEIGKEELATHLGAIERSGRRAADMVKQLLALSRKKDMTFLPADLNRVVRNVLAICQNTFDKVVELKALYADGKAMVLGDALQIEQVLLNLCINAYHAMTMMRVEGESIGGTILVSLSRIRSDEHFVSHHPEASLNRSYWLLSVRDSGVGIPQSVLPKIFDPFFTTKETGQGTGLGLAVAYGIIRQHSGFIDVYSSLNVGTTFNCYIPSIEEEGMDDHSVPEKAIARGEGLILVVDDEPLMRDVARSILHEFGYTALLAEDGEEALAIFRERHGDIKMVLLDIIMPKISGREVCVEMKKIDPDVKVLFASGFSRNDRLDAGEGLEDTHFIQKPYTIKGLVEAVHKRCS
jgi:nitrogen-specific signal transduction histidine kinase/CheY-like chemotaxis protein